MKKSFAASLFLVLGLILIPPSRAQEDEIGARGFSPHDVFNVGDVDSVNLFNGNLTVTLPIGPTYPVGGTFSYQLTLVYNSLVWELETTGSNGEVSPVPSPTANAGLGWTLSLGKLFPPNTIPGDYEGRWTYVGADGARHRFFDDLHFGIDDDSATALYTNDSTYLRMRLVEGAREIDFPDGTIHRFTDHDAESGQDWRLDQIRDAFGNFLAIEYNDVLHRWTLTDSANRTHTVDFLHDSGWDGEFGFQVDEVTLAAFGGLTASYDFVYDTRLPERCYRNQDFVNFPVGTSISTPLLTEIIFPDPVTGLVPSPVQPADLKYQMLDGNGNPDYALSCDDGNIPGGLLSLTLPARGSLEWDYGAYLLPTGGSGGLTDPKLSGSIGVRERRQVDAADDVLGTWRYANDDTRIENNNILVEAETKTYVVYPTDDCTVHYFHALPGREYGLPFSTLAPQSGSLFASTEVWTSYSEPAFPPIACSGTLERSTFVDYENDGFGGGANANSRLRERRVVYDTDGLREANIVFSDFDGLGNYRTEETSGTFPGENVRKVVTNYNDGAGSFPGTFSMPSTSTAWILGTFDERATTEGSGAGAETDLETFCFDSTGFLERRRSIADSSVGEQSFDTLAVFGRDTAGNLTSESYYGGDLQSISTSSSLCTLGLPGGAEYVLEHEYDAGTRKLTRYPAENLTLFDRTIDPSTGLVADTTDPAGLQTTFTYDALGRLKTEKPQLNEGAWVEYTYTHAEPGIPAQVEIMRSENGGGMTLALERIVFDDLGRVFQEKRMLPTLENQTIVSVLNLRETRYNGRGWKDTVSEVVADGSAPAHVTEFSDYDPFGRPGKITPADGAAHDVVLTYKGVSEVTRQVMVAGMDGTASAEYASETVETYDRHGRLLSVAEPSGPGGAPTKTTYEYDAGNRLARVTMIDGVTTQERIFTYDGRGFLTSEQHPEKGESGNGTVTYPLYDSRGHVRRKIDGSGDTVNDLRFTYDGAERLRLVEEDPFGSSIRDLKVFEYGDHTDPARSMGKLVRATRHNYLDPDNLIPQIPADVVIREDYEYDGVDGRASKRETWRDGTLWFEQDFKWTDLGDPARVTYPTCQLAGCSTSGQFLREVDYGYADGFLTSVEDNSTPLATVAYHENEMLESIEHANGVTDVWEVDPFSMRRPLRIRTTGVVGTGFDTGTYAYDGAGNVSAMGTDLFAYDGVSRLVVGSAQGVGESSAYDAFGNRTFASTQPVGARSIPVDPTTNRLQGTAERPVAYDSGGNQVQSGSLTYEYDAMDLLLRSTDTDSRSSHDELFVYTADDERLAIVDNAPVAPNPKTARWRLRDLDGRLLREFQDYGTGAFQWLRDVLHRQGQVLAEDSLASGLRHAHLDHLGTIRMWTHAGAGPSHRSYTAFGEEIISASEPLRFTGHERDPVTLAGCVAGTEVVTVDDQTITEGQTFVGCNRLTSENTTVAAGGEEVRFKAGDEVELGEDFSVEAGATFVVEIDGTLNSTSGDLDYMHARFCSPVSGRFLAVDKAGGQPHQPQSWNRYSYVANNPLKWVDPTGLLRVRANTTSLGDVQFRLVFETNRAKIVGDAVLGGRFLPRRFRKLRKPIDAGRAIDELFRGEFTETSKTLPEKLEFAPFEREVRDVFFEEVGDGVANFPGRFTEKQFMKLGRIVGQVADRLVREGKITEAQRDRILEKYNVERLAREAKSKEPGRNEDDERIPE